MIFIVYLQTFVCLMPQFPDFYRIGLVYNNTITFLQAVKMKSMNLRKKSTIIYISVRAKRGFILPSRAAGLRTSEALRALARRDDHRRPKIRSEERPPQARILEKKYLSLVFMHLSIINCCF